MPTLHKPVLMEETVKFLAPKKNRNFVDCTVSGGGHAERLLELTGPDGKLLGIDWDKEALDLAAARLSQYNKRLTLVHDSYVKFKDIIHEKKFNEISGVLLDLGLSSDQLQSSGRGFTFQANEPLDMRFNPDGNELTAAIIVNEWPENEIQRILHEYGEEKFAFKIAKAIAERRKTQKIETTLDLVRIIMTVVPSRRTKINPATKTFQALRIAVNNELENVKSALKDIVETVEKGARIAVITFHSLEDRIVKQYFKQESKDCICPREIPVCQCGHVAKLKLITKKPIIPSEKEVAENFRSRSAKLRVVERI
ncbi:MAG: 16S rRNA (cytosine(1402)-N(4))-methyltransferase RsmH [Parcubacteria group bacterium]